MNVPGFFTALPEYRLPHPQVPVRVILTTHLALVTAFELLRANPPAGFFLSTAKEDDITRQLHSILEDRLLDTNEVKGFDRRRIKNVVRAPEVTNYDGTHPAKKPDLVLFLMKREHLALRSSQYAIFAECKPVDKSHSVEGHYCAKGISRFVNGEYAWAMQEGMMIAYARAGCTISKDLAPALASGNSRKDLGSPSEPVVVGRSGVSSNAEALHSTLHHRSFAWPAGQGNACPIRVFHSWHNCS
jgi:hypothetical protein